MATDPAVLSRLTRKGYIQCPLDWCLTFGPNRFAEARLKWYETFAGQRILLGALVLEMRDNILAELRGYRFWIARHLLRIRGK